jgi:hypothetical protein
VSVGEMLQIAKRPRESHKLNPHLMVEKSPYLSVFLTPGYLLGAKINISLSSDRFIYYSNQSVSGRSASNCQKTRGRPVT